MDTSIHLHIGRNIGRTAETHFRTAQDRTIVFSSGMLCERGMPVAVDLFRRAFVASRLNASISTISTENGIIRAKGTSFCFRTGRTGPKLQPGNCAMQRTTRWLTAILRGPSSMNTGSDFYFDPSRVGTYAMALVMLRIADCRNADVKSTGDDLSS